MCSVWSCGENKSKSHRTFSSEDNSLRLAGAAMPSFLVLPFVVLLAGLLVVYVVFLLRVSFHFLVDWSDQCGLFLYL
jgi:hypothetical protein